MNDHLPTIDYQLLTVIKVSGHELDDPAYLSEFAAAIHSLNAPTVIVHGGGAEISAMQKVMGIEPRYVDGVRITDPDSLKVVEMVLCGTVNKRLVRYLLAAGVDALGMSGVDRGLVRARQMQRTGQDMGFTGEVVAVRGDLLKGLLEQGITPVIAPVSLGETSSLNVNADHVAGAVAAAVGAARAVFLTNIEGVLSNDQLLSTLTPDQTQRLIDDGTIFGGMIPKVQTALHALTTGVQSAVITNLKGLKSGTGTVFAA
ncbi:MAG: acetylglutamate kinase [Anaerolineae bacterium]